MSENNAEGLTNTNQYILNDFSSMQLMSSKKY